MPQPDGPTLAEQLADQYASVADELAVGGVPLSSLAERYGTPLYVYEAERMRRIFRDLSEAVAGFASIFYSIMANPNPAVVRVFVREGAGLEIASAAESIVARAASAAPERILFAGPGKRPDELAYVITDPRRARGDRARPLPRGPRWARCRLGIASKLSRGTRFLVIDGGMHHHLAASDNLG